MAGNETGDLLMMVLATPGNPIDGESSSVLSPSGPLLKGFKPNKMFEISGFQFGVTTLSDSKKGSDKKQDAFFAQFASLGHVVGPAAANLASTIAKGVPDIGAEQGDPKSCPVDEITFNRPIDKASNTLMRYCINCTTLHGAVVVKRKPAGGLSAGEAYLRLEFIDVLFINMDWSNGEPVEERCTFITRAVNVLYRPQLPDGSLGAVKSGFWSRKPDSKGEELTY